MSKSKITDQKIFLSNFIVKCTYYGYELYKFVQVGNNTYMLMQATSTKFPSAFKNYQFQHDRVRQAIPKKHLMNLFYGDYETECYAIQYEIGLSTLNKMIEKEIQEISKRSC